MTDDLDGAPAQFFSLYPSAPPPRNASRDLDGTMPVRPARLCTPYTTACGFGWYLFPPTDFAVRVHDGYPEWTLLEHNEPVAWHNLAGGQTGWIPEGERVMADLRERQVGGRDVFDKYGGVPFIEADPRDPTMFEVIPGILARTPPGWSLLLRDVPNRIGDGSYDVLEGVIATDWYRAYLPLMIRVRIAERTIRFHRRMPLMVAQPVPESALARGSSRAVHTAGVETFPAEVWQEFVDWRRRKQDPATAATYAQEHKHRRRHEQVGAGEGRDADA